MASHNDFGQWGEEVAANYLQRQGYTILARNWHHEHKEIDIIAEKGESLYFVEVKTRHGETWKAEEAVTAQKRSQMIRATYAWKREHPSPQPVYYAILAVVMHAGNPSPEIRFTPNAFYTVRG